MSSKINDKLKGTLIGLAVGDAMGAPYEFLVKGYKVLPEYKTGGTHNVSIGEFTDDTSMALCLAKSIIETGGFDPIDQMTKYLDWYRNGYMSTREICFDIGTTTRNSIIAFEHSKKTVEYTQTGTKESNGNGTIMRLAPIVMKFHNSDKLLNYAKKSSLTTHKGEEAYKCAILLAEIIRNCYMFNNKELIIQNSSEYFTDKITYKIINTLEEFVEPTGYCIDTMIVALRGFLHFDNFIDGLLYCISLGNDTDTVGAVYGQIAGSYYGLSGIPDYYKENLMYNKKILEIAEELIKGNR